MDGGQSPSLDMDRGAWQATVHGVPELDTTEHKHRIRILKCKGQLAALLGGQKDALDNGLIAWNH